MIKFLEQDDLDRCRTAKQVVLKAVELELNDDDIVPYMLTRGWPAHQIDRAYKSATGAHASVCDYVGLSIEPTAAPTEGVL